MKFYTLTFNANLPTKNQLNIPTNTDYKIGVKVVRNGELLDLDPADVTLGALSADADKTNGYVTFTTAAGDDASYTQKKLAIVHVPNESKLVVTPPKQGTASNVAYSLSATGFNSFFVDDIALGFVTSTSAQPLSTDVTTFDKPSFWPPVVGAGDVVGAMAKMVFPNAGTTGATYWRMGSKTYNALYDDPDNPALSAIVIGNLPRKGTPLALKQEPDEDTWTPVRKIEVYDNAVLIQGVYKPRNTYATAVLKVEDSKPVDLKFDLLENIFKSQQGDIGLSGGGGDVPADVATKSWVESEISGFVDEDALTAYATKDELTAYAETDDLTAYYTKSETSSASEIGTALTGKVANLSAVSGIMKISQADYDTLSAGGTADANTLYVIV